MITFEQLTFTYPNAAQPILRDVNLTIVDGAFALLCGPSGAGKSTLLRCLNGLVPHFSGGVMRGTVRVNDLNPVLATPQVMSRHVGFVFQDPEAQFVTDVVEDEIAFALENAAVPHAEMRVRIEEALDLLELAALRDRALSTLSGGERQRVAIAAALALRPRVLALDEPTSQLDPKSAEDVLQALVRLNTDLGLTIVLVEHRLERVLPYVDTLIYLPPDRSDVLNGSPRDVLDAIDLTPPLITLGKALNWWPLPLTIKDGLAWSAKTLANEPHAARRAPSAVTVSSDRHVYIEMRHVAAGYGPQRIVRDLSLTIRAGEIVALIGRNGSGKTTLLKTIVGLLPVQHGEVRIADQTIAGQSVADICRRVGYLPQDPNALLFADTVEEELRITLRNHGLSTAEASVAPIVSDLLARLKLADKAAAYPRDLSVGERQRVALGAIAITQPGALVLDEPTRGLDYVAKQNLSQLLGNWRDAGMAILIVTHDVELVAAIADRVVLLSQGEIIADGSPSDVLGTSPFFAPQIARLFPGHGWLTVREALQGLGGAMRGRSPEPSDLEKTP